MRIQHNMTAQNANRQLGSVTSSQAKSTEKLSSGYRINRAADDAAGLSISEKMRSQIRGLSQASANAQDGISLIQTAEGALNEQHSILQRMRELSVQAANGTETNDDRQAVQDEISQLQDELTRIADTTEFNTMKLLDGSLGGSSSSSGAGPKFGSIDTAGNLLTSNVAGIDVQFTYDAGLQKGAEFARWDDAGAVLSITLKDGLSYTQDQIDDLIKNAKQEDSSASGTPAEVKFTLNNGVLNTQAANGNGGVPTVAGFKAISGPVTATADFVGADTMELTNNRYGEELNDTVFNFTFDAKPGKEEVIADTEIVFGQDNKAATTGIYNVKLQSGKEYTSEDIQDILKTAGFDFKVELTGNTPDAPDTLFITNAGNTEFTFTMENGAGLSSSNAVWGQDGYEDAVGGGDGMTLQIGANEGQTMSFAIGDMSARSLGVDGNKVDLSSQESAKKATTIVDSAIKTVSQNRGRMGAIQNRLEHTITNLDTSAENIQTAEARIRDVDMASEMVTYSKNNILQQAAQSMLAQANQSTQGVLSLLQ